MSNVFSLSKIFSEFKLSLSLAFPLIASEVIYALNGFIGTVMVAHLGKEELAANALVWGIYITVILFFIGVLCSVSIMVSQSFGARDTSSCSVCFQQGLIMALIFTIPMMLLMWHTPIALSWTGQNPQVIERAVPLCHALVWTMLPLNIWFVFQQFLLGITKPRLVMAMSILAVPVEIIFYYLFLFGKFGMPKLGLAGIGYGLTAADCMIVILFVFYLSWAQYLKGYRLFQRWWVFNPKFFFEMLKVGLPLGFMYCSEVALFAVVAIMMGILGTSTLAAYQIAYQFLMVALVIIFALTQNVSMRVGNEVGRNNREALSVAAFVNLAIGMSIMLCFSVVYLFLPHLVLNLDIDVHAQSLNEVVNEATKFLALISVLILIDCVRLIHVGALRGLKDTRFPLFASILGFWCIAFPTAYLLAFRLRWGGSGIWVGVITGLCVTGILLILRFLRVVKNVDLLGMVTKIEA